jgi:hypothetical protein
LTAFAALALLMSSAGVYGLVNAMRPLGTN